MDEKEKGLRKSISVLMSENDKMASEIARLKSSNASYRSANTRMSTELRNLRQHSASVDEKDKVIVGLQSQVSILREQLDSALLQLRECRIENDINRENHDWYFSLPWFLRIFRKY